MIELWVVSFSLILTRVGTFVALMPLFGGRNVPHLVKVGIAMALTSSWFMSFGLVPRLELYARFAHADWLTFGLALAREAILGAALGYGFGLFLVPFRVAGEILGQEMGLSVSSLFDPTSEQPGGALTQVFETMGVLLFLGLDGHHVFLAALHATFVRWPIGSIKISLPTTDLVSGTAAAQEWGVLLAGPLILVMFLTTVVLALLARAAPQMNLFSVGFALRLAAGLVTAFILLPEMVGVMVGILGHVNQLVLGVLDGLK